MSDIQGLFQKDASKNFRDIEARIKHLETLEGSISAPVSGSALSLSIVTVTSNYTVLLSDFNILSDATAGAITITLPTASSAFDLTNSIGHIFNILRINTNGNAVTIAGNGAELIYSPSSPSGNNTLILSNPLDSVTIQSNGTSFYVW